jgi:hypothetical protein
MPKKKSILQATNTLKAAIVTVNPSVASHSYSLVRDKEIKTKELFKLEKQLNLANHLLSSAEGDQFSRLTHKKNACLEKKTSLQKTICTIDRIQAFVKECMLFFEFIEEFYIFSMELLCSEQETKSVRQKLYKLKRAEETLVKLKAVEKYFLNEGLNGLNYADYQSAIESYRANFYLKESSAEGLYSRYALLARKIYLAFVEDYPRIAQAEFNLEQIASFIQEYIPSSPPVIEHHHLVGVWSFFFYTILFEFIKLQPINSNLAKFQESVRAHTAILQFPAEENILYKSRELQKKIIKLEKHISEKFGKEQE